MRIALLTFHFAYNYGAALQAFALREYLASLGNEVDVVPYYPPHLRSAYSISPLEKGISLRHRVYNLMNYGRRVFQAERFDLFKHDLSGGNEFSKQEEALRFIQDYHLLVCGSDQIWNSGITGNTGVYFGGGTGVQKISYAASVGSASLDAAQRRYAQKYLPSFLAVSVREECSKTLLENVRKDIAVVCDPVFLFRASEWERQGKPVKTDGRYLLLYLLEENAELLERAEEYAEQNNLTIYEIHPTLAMRHKGISRLDCVGPREFIYLVSHADAVCTNSFHAVSFSIIFSKTLLHIPNSVSPERTKDVLKRAGIDLRSDSPVYQLDNAISELEGFIQYSQEFINRSLNIAESSEGVCLHDETETDCG